MARKLGLEIRNPHGSEVDSAPPPKLANKPRVGLKLQLQLEGIQDLDQDFVGLLLIASHHTEEATVSRLLPGYNVESAAGWISLRQADRGAVFSPSLWAASVKVWDCVEHDVFVRPTGEVFAWHVYRIQVAASMPLHDFPLDRQQLRIGLTCRDAHLGPFSLEDAPVQHWPSTFQVSTDMQHWRLVECNAAEFLQSEFQVYVRCRFRVARRPGLFLWNYTFVIWLLVLLHSVVLTVPLNNSADRVAVSLTILLTITALKLVASADVPSVGYLTKLDSYIVFAVAWIGVATIEMAIVAGFSTDNAEFAWGEESTWDDASMRNFDRLFHIVHALVWSLLHMALAVLYRSGKLYRDWGDIVRAHKSTRQVVDGFGKLS